MPKNFPTTPNEFELDEFEAFVRRRAEEARRDLRKGPADRSLDLPAASVRTAAYPSGIAHHRLKRHLESLRLRFPDDADWLEKALRPMLVAAVPSPDQIEASLAAALVLVRTLAAEVPGSPSKSRAATEIFADWLAALGRAPSHAALHGLLSAASAPSVRRATLEQAADPVFREIDRLCRRGLLSSSPLPSDSDPPED